MGRLAAGKMRHLVDFQKDTSTAQGTRGHTTANWITQFRGYCEITPLSGDELIQARQVYATVTHQITTRFCYSSTPDPTWRVKYGSRLFNVVSIVNVDERNEYWQIMAVELPSVA